MSAATGRPGRGRPKTFRRDHVIDVAMENYWREGIDGLSLNEICRRAGVSKPGLYREFGGEDGLMAAVLSRYADVVLRPMMEHAAGEGSFAETLVGLVRVMTERDDARPAGCLFAKLRRSSSSLGSETQGRVDGLRRLSREAYADLIVRAKARGEVAAAVATPVAAAFLDTQVTTLLNQVADGEDPEMIRAQARLALAGLVGGQDKLELAERSMASRAL